MSITIHNNTKWIADEAWNDVKHLMLPTGLDNVVSIEINDKTMTAFVEDCILFEHELSKPLAATGTIRWFDKSSGVGYIRLASGYSVVFYACNVVGANSHYHQLTTNVDFREGQTVSFEISTDPYMFAELGATKIKTV